MAKPHALVALGLPHLFAQRLGCAADFAAIEPIATHCEAWSPPCSNTSAFTTVPYGYRYVSKANGGWTARFEVIEAVAYVVRKMFGCVALERVSLREVRRRLVAAGYETRGGQSHRHPSAAPSMLTNMAYIGRAVYEHSRYVRDLITSLAKAEREGSLRERIRFLCRPQLLIVDEIGYLPVIRNGGNLFFQMVNARYEKGAMVPTSNRGFSEWAEVFSGSVDAGALLDRLLHHAVVVQMVAASALGTVMLTNR